MSKQNWQGPAAQMVMLLHMATDLVEDGKISDVELNNSLLDALHETMLLALEWRLLEAKDESPAS